LRRLIDKEHVDRIDSVRTTPKPSGPASDPTIVMKSCKACRIISRESQARLVDSFLLHHLDAGEVEPELLRSSANLIQELAALEHDFTARIERTSRRDAQSQRDVREIPN
jgi:hypothetical protein